MENSSSKWSSFLEAGQRLKLEWRGPRANNNGRIRLSFRRAAERLGVSVGAAARAFHALLAKGFIVVTQEARLGIGGEAKSPAYEITELALPSSDRSEGRKTYREWKEGQDFPIKKSMTNKVKNVLAYINVNT